LTREIYLHYRQDGFIIKAVAEALEEDGMRKVQLSGCLAVVLCCVLPAFVYAQSYKVVIGDIPNVSDGLKLRLTQLAEATGVKFDITLVPMARLAYMIENKQADIGFPIIYLNDKNKIQKLNYDYSSAVFTILDFNLYSNDAKPIDIQTLKKGNSKNYAIEVDVSNISLFEFSAQPSTNIVGSLTKVNGGAIDGYLTAQQTGDPVLEKLKFTNIKSQLYERFESGFLLQKGAKGGPLDKILVEGVKKLIEKGIMTVPK
jgi:hypothetical protein